MIGIHKRKGSFSGKWVKYLEEHEIPFYEIDLFSNNILDEILNKGINKIFFHLNSKEYKNELIVKDLVYLLEKKGVDVFPSIEEFWHYDDKIKQKYLFEAYDIPHAPMHVFYSKQDSLGWVENKARFPFVFKLRKGAGSSNVKLVKTKNQAKKLINRSFGKGFKVVPSFLKDMGPKIRKHKKQKDWLGVIKRLPKTLSRHININKNFTVERGYFLTQEFYPNNDTDTRVAIIGDKATAFRRYVRKNDFRASGSGLIDYDHNMIDLKLIKIAFDAADKIGGTSFAFDFIYDADGIPKILEVSYCYLSEAITNVGGYWDRNLEFHKSEIIPEYEILKFVLKDNK